MRKRSRASGILDTRMSADAGTTRASELVVAHQCSFCRFANQFTETSIVRHGDYIAKVRFAPEPGSAKNVVKRTLDLASAAEL